MPIGKYDRSHLRKSHVGERYGRLVVTGDAPDGKRNSRRFICQCDCGNQTEVSFSNLSSKQIVSCGCFQKDTAGQHTIKHRKSNSPEYAVWRNMISRCTKPSNIRWGDYGGRGIKVCDEWLVFENFWKDMGDRPTPKHQLDRINNDLGYFRDNCRWATVSENMRNRRGYKTNKTGVQGVCVTAKGKFLAQVHHEGKRILNKTFETMEEAAEAVAKIREEIDQ